MDGRDGRGRSGWQGWYRVEGVGAVMVMLDGRGRWWCSVGLSGMERWIVAAVERADGVGVAMAGGMGKTGRAG